MFTNSMTDILHMFWARLWLIKLFDGAISVSDFVLRTIIKIKNWRKNAHVVKRQKKWLKITTITANIVSDIGRMESMNDEV